MSDILLSICIPTYNRVDEVTNSVKRIISGCSSDMIEIVVSDNASTDGTKKEISKIKDPRIKYYRNKMNLGIGGNVLKMIERSRGDFIFIHWDDEYIELSSIPWLLEVIKNNKNINQILGTIRQFGKVWWSCKKLLCEEDKDEILEPGPESLGRILFSYYHGGGRVLRRESINLDYAWKYINSPLYPYMHQIIEVYPVLTGSTLCTNRTLYHHVKKQNDVSAGHLFNGRTYWNHLNRLQQLKVRIKIINDITKKKKDQRVLLNRQRDYATSLFFDSLYTSLFRYKSLNYFLNIFQRILHEKEISRHPTFWLRVFQTGIYDILMKIGIISLLKINCPRSIHVSLG